MKNNEKGITLIALVITIIILLILAGISIIAIGSNNGLFARAKQAKKNTLDAECQENVILDDYENKIDTLISSNRGTTEELNSIVEQANSLSFDEKKIGKFVDGKTLYQKTIKTNFTTEESQSYNHNIENVDIIYIDTGNTFFIKEDGYSSPYFSAGISSGDVVPGYTKMVQTVTNTCITIRGCTNAGTGVAYVTLKYTKTVD